MAEVFTLDIGADEVRLLGDQAEVTSASQPGTHHNVAFGICDCKGFEYRGTCRHINAVQAAQAIAKAAATCPHCGRHAEVAQIKRWGRCSLCVLNGSATPVRS